MYNNMYDIYLINGLVIRITVFNHNVGCTINNAFKFLRNLRNKHNKYSSTTCYIDVL